jgi:hypothetical protein
LSDTSTTGVFSELTRLLEGDKPVYRSSELLSWANGQVLATKPPQPRRGIRRPVLFETPLRVSCWVARPADDRQYASYDSHANVLDDPRANISQMADSLSQ